MQAKGVVHRDIKPANILVSEHGDFKIADLGIAIETGHSVQGRVRTFKAGTILCMAPEILHCRPYNERADVWSLGCTLYEMAHLEPAFPAQSNNRWADLGICLCVCVCVCLCILHRCVYASTHTHRDSDLKTVAAMQQEKCKTAIALPACFSGALQELLNDCLTYAQAERPHARDLLDAPTLVSKAAELGFPEDEGPAHASLVKKAEQRTPELGKGRTPPSQAAGGFRRALSSGAVPSGGALAAYKMDAV